MFYGDAGKYPLGGTKIFIVVTGAPFFKSFLQTMLLKAAHGEPLLGVSQETRRAPSGCAALQRNAEAANRRASSTVNNPASQRPAAATQSNLKQKLCPGPRRSPSTTSGRPGRTCFLAKVASSAKVCHGEAKSTTTCLLHLFVGRPHVGGEQMLGSWQ